MVDRIGRQLPTLSLILPYEETQGIEAIESYESSGRTAQPWQRQMVYDIRAVNDDGFFTHAKFGYEVPRRNGKGEILIIVELDDLRQGRKTLHTAHRTTTATSASLRLANILKDMGYEELQRVKNQEKHEKQYTYLKTIGLEKIVLLDTGGEIHFRTRTNTGGLGEGFDTLVVDEAQEYTADQQNTLQYVVSDSDNPQIILCGTPPTLVSKGREFQKLRENCFSGQTGDTGWAEWSVDFLTDVNDVDAWYECNPAMGYQLSERNIRNENKDDVLDFNIQRFGYWSEDNLQSAITKSDWDALKIDGKPKVEKPYHAGVKCGADGVNIALSIVSRCDDKIYVSGIDCQSARNGNNWIVSNILNINPESVTIDGAGTQDILASELKDAGYKGNIILPKVKEVIIANSLFEQAIFGQTICHSDQPSMTQAVTNCQKRAIGTNGGFGYRTLKPGIEVALMDSIILAHWTCATTKKRKKQKVSY